MSKMTPGPWRVTSDSNPGLKVMADDRMIARVRGCGIDQGDDNARAIACLPELVEAARGLLVGWYDVDSLGPTYRELKRILARIDGEGRRA